MANAQRSAAATDSEQSIRPRPELSLPGDARSHPLVQLRRPTESRAGRRSQAALGHSARESLFRASGLDTTRPVIAFAIHHGHGVRADIRSDLALCPAARKREEDPYTGELARAVQARVVVRRSRFEVDLNRPPPGAVYAEPADAWGLQVWRQPLPQSAKRDSVLEYRDFYGAVYAILADFERRFGRFLVLDIHSYNHRRAGPDAPASPTPGNPQVNVGTSSLDRQLWLPVIDRFLHELGRPRLSYGALDVRENVKFQGGQFVTWISQNFPETACPLALEFKKTFMDEWTGRVDRAHLNVLRSRLRSATRATLPELERIG